MAANINPDSQPSSFADSPANAAGATSDALNNSNTSQMVNTGAQYHHHHFANSSSSPAAMHGDGGYLSQHHHHHNSQHSSFEPALVPQPMQSGSFFANAAQQQQQPQISPPFDDFTGSSGQALADRGDVVGAADGGEEAPHFFHPTPPAASSGGNIVPTDDRSRSSSARPNSARVTSPSAQQQHGGNQQQQQHQLQQQLQQQQRGDDQPGVPAAGPLAPPRPPPAAVAQPSPAPVGSSGTSGATPATGATPVGPQSKPRSSGNKLRDLVRLLPSVVTLDDPQVSSAGTMAMSMLSPQTSTAVDAAPSVILSRTLVDASVTTGGASAAPSAPVAAANTTTSSSRSTSPLPPTGAAPAPFVGIRILGTGAYGTAILARTVGSDALVCLKVLRLAAKPRNTSEERRKSRAYSEVSCMRACSFFSLVAFYNSGSVLPKHASPRKVNDLRAAVTEARTSSRHESGGAGGGGGDSHGDAEGSNAATSLGGSGSGGTNEEVLYIVMEYADCGDMRQEIKFRAKGNDLFHEREAALLFIQLLLGVHHMHTRRIMHRDIKSANCFMLSNGLIKLGDFGFAKEMGGGEEPETAFLGTPYYLAPEVWKRQPYDYKVDIFAVGVVFYELLTLQRPFRGVDVRAVRHAIEHGHYEPLPQTITAETRATIEWMLSRDPRSRPSTRELMQTPYVQGLLVHFSRAVRANDLIDPTTKKSILAQVQQIHSEFATTPVRSLLSTGTTPNSGSQSAHQQQSSQSSAGVDTSGTSNGLQHIGSDSRDGSNAAPSAAVALGGGPRPGSATTGAAFDGSGSNANTSAPRNQFTTTHVNNHRQSMGPSPGGSGVRVSPAATQGGSPGSGNAGNGAPVDGHHDPSTAQPAVMAQQQQQQPHQQQPQAGQKPSIEILCQGVVFKETGNGAWKERFLRLHRRTATGVVELVMAVNEQATNNQDKCIATPASEFSRVSVDETNDTGRGFVLLSRKWKKLRFMAHDDADHAKWMGALERLYNVGGSGESGTFPVSNGAHAPAGGNGAQM